MKEKKEKIYIGHEVMKTNEFSGYSYVYGELNGCICDHIYYISKCFTLLKKVGKNKYANYLDESLVYDLIDPNELVCSQDVLGCNECENFKFNGMLNCSTHPLENSVFIGVLDVSPLTIIDDDVEVAKFIIDEYNIIHGNSFMQITDSTYKSIIKGIDSYCHSLSTDREIIEYPKKVKKLGVK